MYSELLALHTSAAASVRSFELSMTTPHVASNSHCRSSNPAGLLRCGLQYFPLMRCSAAICQSLARHARTLKARSRDKTFQQSSAWYYVSSMNRAVRHNASIRLSKLTLGQVMPRLLDLDDMEKFMQKPLQIVSVGPKLEKPLCMNQKH